MNTMTISLPDAMREFVESQVKSGSYGTASEYIRNLIRHEQERREKLEYLRREIALGIEQLERGEVSELNMDEIKAEGRRRLAARKGK